MILFFLTKVFCSPKLFSGIPFKIKQIGRFNFRAAVSVYLGHWVIEMFYFHFPTSPTKQHLIFLRLNVSECRRMSKRKVRQSIIKSAAQKLHCGPCVVRQCLQQKLLGAALCNVSLAIT